MTWGDARYGDDRSAVQDQLRIMQHTQASSFVLAAILADGFAVNDRSAVQDQLRIVQRTQVSSFAWGDARYGDDSSAVQDQLREVQHIQASSFAFATSSLMDPW